MGHCDSTVKKRGWPGKWAQQDHEPRQIWTYFNQKQSFIITN